jgi:hypothetical protein
MKNTQKIARTISELMDIVEGKASKSTIMRFLLSKGAQSGLDNMLEYDYALPLPLQHLAEHSVYVYNVDGTQGAFNIVEPARKIACELIRESILELYDVEHVKCIM